MIRPPVELSIELFPPKTEKGRDGLWPEVTKLAALRPSFVSVTCGASGTDTDRTAPLIEALAARFAMPLAAHLTCAGADREDVRRLAERYWQGGVRRIVALRGDMPRLARYRPRADGHANAAALVTALKRLAPFHISVAGYPECHPESADQTADLDNLKAKVDAGADQILTQYCFDADQVLRFRDAVRARGIEVPIGVGIIPIHDFPAIRRFSESCGATIPPWLAHAFAGLEDQPDMANIVAAGVAADHARRLIEGGIHHLHFYALNRSRLTLATMRILAADQAGQAA